MRFSRLQVSRKSKADRRQNTPYRPTEGDRRTTQNPSDRPQTTTNTTSNRDRSR
ncbi:hypothetical protein POG22_03715 [Geitlerinema sp. CS-897]|nr:hypothetical protein [Geitlerinema sp. CS-897]